MAGTSARKTTPRRLPQRAGRNAGKSFRPCGASRGSGRSGAIRLDIERRRDGCSPANAPGCCRAKHQGRLDISFRYALPFDDRFEATLLADFFNVTNRTNFNQMGSDIISSGSFLIPSAAHPPREIQLGARFTF